MTEDRALDEMKRVDKKIHDLVMSYGDNDGIDYRVKMKEVDRLYDESWRLACIVWPDLATRETV